METEHTVESRSDEMKIIEKHKSEAYSHERRESNTESIQNREVVGRIKNGVAKKQSLGKYLECGKGVYLGNRMETQRGKSLRRWSV